MVSTPELDKQSAREADIKIVLEFLEWFDSKEYEVATRNADFGDRLTPVNKNHQQLIQDWLKIDESKCEAERLAILNDWQKKAPE